jgi:hypothetical protein
MSLYYFIKIPWFKSQRAKGLNSASGSENGKKINKGGKGLGYRERPGLGHSSASSSVISAQVKQLFFSVLFKLFILILK